MRFNREDSSSYCTRITDGTHDSPSSVEVGYPLITSKHLNRLKLDIASTNRISYEDFRKISVRSQVDQWDVLVSMIGTVGRVYIQRGKDIGFACKNVGILKNGGDELKAKWLFYYLQSPEGNSQLLSFSRGTTQGYIPLGALKNLSIPVPPLRIMRSAVEILWNLDSKILVNEQINKNLLDLDFARYQSG